MSDVKRRPGGWSVAVRADSSAELGMGHVTRTLVLAEALRRRGAEVVFVCRELPGHATARVERAGFAVSRLVLATDAEGTEGDAEVLDAEATLAALRPWMPRWVVVDHYGLGALWESALRATGAKVVAIDDLVHRVHDVDILVDQNFGSGRDRTERASGAAHRLIGPRYALLHQAYREARELLPERSGPPRRVLVAFGGGDLSDETSKALEALRAPALSHLAVDVIVGKNHPNPQRVRALAAERAAVTVYDEMPTLTGLMMRADVAVGAGGSTTWERLCLGLPSVVAVVAENQAAFTEDLARQGYVCQVEARDGTTATSYQRALEKVLTEGLRSGAGLVDGWGAERVAEVMCPTQRSGLQVTRDGNASWRVDAHGLEVGRLRSTLADVSSPGVTLLETRLDPVVRHRLAESDLAAQVTSGLGSPASLGGAAPQGCKVVVLSTRSSWCHEYAAEVVADLLEEGHVVEWSHDADLVHDGDLCFLLSWERIVPASFRSRFHHTLVVHASDLPRGRGWSPLTWQVLQGADEVVVSLLEAADAVDAGPIYQQVKLRLQGHELLTELQGLVGEATVALCRGFVAQYRRGAVHGRPQEGAPTYFERRRAPDSRLDPEQTLAAQFDLLRVVDNEKYPAFFDLRGRRFVLRIEGESRPTPDA